VNITGREKDGEAMDDYLAEQLTEHGLDPTDYEHLEEFEIKEMLAELCSWVAPHILMDGWP
jgi:hypothetical protein